jgi:Lrp/AsnC family transcriptional regulator, leucine-responsive regulatory protein
MLDEVDRRIIDLLAKDARISLKELAQRVNLSSPSASERLKRLEERGVIRAFTVEVEPKALGYTLQAIVRVRPAPGQMPRIQKLIEEIPQFTECDKVTGDDCFVVRLFARSIEEMDEIIDRIGDKAETSTAIVKAQPLKRRLPPL